MKEHNLEATLHRLTQPKQGSIQQEILKKKAFIQSIKVKHAEKVLLAEMQTKQRAEGTIINKISSKKSKNQDQNIQSKAEKTQKIDSSNGQRKKTQSLIQTSAKNEKYYNKNPGVGDTDKMIFEKKYKNFLNHREEFQRKARQRRQKIIELRKAKQQGTILADQNQFIDKQELMSDDCNQNQFGDAQDMQAAYEQIVTGKRTKKDGALHHVQKFEYFFRKNQFDYLLLLEISQNQNSEEIVNQSESNQNIPTLITKVSKDTILNYLFDQPCIMMLYSINPYQLGDELAEFQTETQNLLTFEQFSSFLVTDRQPTYVYYTRQNLEEARKMGRGIKCMPIIAKWIQDQQTLQWLIQLFKQIDFLGELSVERAVLAKKIKRQAKKKRILNIDVVQVVNINKTLPLNRLLYELEFGVMESDKITLEEFQSFLKDYKRIPTPQKDKLLTKLILSGKYDPSYIFILGAQSLQILKDAFKSTQKFAEYFVLKEKFIQKLTRHPKYNKIKANQVRSQGNRYVKKQNIEQALLRFNNQGEIYVDLEEILDFFTNRGRPQKTQYQIYMINLQIQLQRIQKLQREKQQKKLSQGDASTLSSDQDSFQNQIRQKKVDRKKKKLASIRNSQNFGAGKKFNITVPNTFSFGIGTKDKNKLSIRQKKVRQMLQQKLRLQNQSMRPIKSKEVPNHVKQNLYQRIMRDQERQRNQRLQKFKIQSQERMYPVSDRLTKPKQTDIHCSFGVQPDKFVAKPLPWYCEVNLMERIQKQKLERKQRILQEVINKHSEYDLPDGVKMMIQRQQQMIERKKNARSISATTVTDPECTFMPHITQGVPDFKMIHEHWNIDLENKKQEKEAIKVQPFSFENRQNRSKTTTEPHKIVDLRYSKANQYKPQDKDINIPITLKYEALIELRRKQQEERVRKFQEQQKAKTIRKMRQQKFAPYVRSVLRKNEQDPAKSRKVIEERIKQFKKEEKRKKNEYQQEMINIYTKVFNRPLLIESSGTFGQNQIKRQGIVLNQEEYDEYEREQNANDRRHNKVEQYAEDYDMSQQNENQIEQQYSKRHPAEYEQMRRKAIDHPPRNYLMEDNQYQEDQEGEGYQQEGQYEEGQYEEGQYLSQNGRYTN